MIRLLFQSICILFFSFLFLSGSAFSKPSIQRLISGADGLDAVVNDITVDEHGFIWLATEHGIFRASNTDLTRIELTEIEHQLQDEYFDRIHNLGQNKILVDAYQGMYFFDFSSNEFSPVSTLAAFSELSSGRFSKLQSLNHREQLLLTANGQLIYFTDITSPAIKKIQLPILNQENYRDIVTFNGERLLIASENQLGLMTHNDELDWLKAESSLENIHQLIVVDERIWLAADSGFYEITIDLDARSYRTKRLVESAVFSISVDSKQVLWLSSNEGIFSYETSTNELHHQSKSLNRDVNFAVSNKLMVDNNDLIWVAGTQNQIAVMADQVDFLKDMLSVQAPYFLGEQNVWSIYGEHHTLYAGASNQITVINRKVKSSIPITIHGLNPSESIYEIKPLDKHSLLLATTDGLFVFNKGTFHSQTFGEWLGNKRASLKKIIFQTTFDSKSQRWWFATSGGVHYWDLGSSEIKAADFGIGNNQGVRSVFVDSNGTLWAGGEHIFGYYRNDEFTPIDKRFFDKDILPAVSHITQIDGNRLWLGSTFHGIFELNLSNHKVSKIPALSGEICDTTYFLHKVAGKPFIGCRNGVLVQYDLANDKFTAFDKSDGLISKEFNEGTVFFQPKVGFFIGTPEGIMLLDTNKLSKRVSNDGIFVSEVIAYYSDNSDIKLLPKRSGTVFEPNAGLVSFHIASHNYLNNDLRSVNYRLLGDKLPPQKEFIQLLGNAKINLSNLEPGNYTLQLVNDEVGQFAAKPYEFHFKISQPWWHAEQFKSLLAFIVFTLGVLTVLRHQNRTDKFRRLNSKLQETQDRLQQALKSSDSDLWEWHTSEAQLHIGNYSQILSNCSGQKVYKLADLRIHPDDQACVLDKWNQMLSGNRDSFDAEYRQMDFDGQWRWIRSKGRPVTFSPDLVKVETVAGIYTDVTSTKNLEEQAGLLAEAFANTSEGVVIFDENETAVVVNPAAKKLLEINDDNIESVLFSNIIVGVDTDIKTLLETERHWAGELELVASTGQRYPVWITLSHITSKPYVARKYVAVFSDISQRKSAEEKLRRLANFDPLTGLANRTLFSEKLLDNIQQAQRENSRLALMFMDLDRFKNINDSYGHNMGDALLIEAASRIQESVGNDAVLSRFGGDEFVLLLPNIGNTHEVDDVAKRIHRSIEAPFRLFEREFFISTSIGVSLWPDHATQPEALIKNADLAMYHAKEDGPGNVRYFSNARNEKNLYFLRIESELRKAIEKNQFELHYQPQINILEGDKLIGMEALLRWKHPEDGFIRPDIFIEVAESAGLIIEIDRWVFKTACEQISKWHKQYDANFKVSINVSAAHFLQPDYVDTIRDVMLQTGVEAKHIGLEITEGVLMREVDQAQKHLSELQLLGISVAIDDFGTGYSSLAYLRNFPVNILKIDRKFIIDINHNRADQAIVTSIIELARNLRLSVVAEGIETYEQMEHLIGRGCYLMQGYYFAKPLTLKEMNQYLEQTVHLGIETEY